MNVSEIGSSARLPLEDQAPPVGVIETLTGSPFGAQLEHGMPFFDPVGWHPETGVDSALALLGWSGTRTDGSCESAALDRLRAACSVTPVLVGPATPAEQSRLLGSLQYPLVVGADAALRSGLYLLAPEYDRLRDALAV